MEKHGLQRGILYSTAQHEDVRRHYGAQQMSKEKLAEVAAPIKVTSFQLDTLKPWERVRPQEYQAREQARLNAYIAQLVAEANRKLSQVATVATANTLERERAQALKKRLVSSQELLVGTRDELSATKTQLQQQQARTEKAQLHHGRQSRGTCKMTHCLRHWPRWLATSGRSSWARWSRCWLNVCAHRCMSWLT